MIEKLLIKELKKRIQNRFKLSGSRFSKKKANEYFKMISKEIVDNILEDVIDPVDESRGWRCTPCNAFIPGDEVYLDQDEYLHVPKKGTCNGTCHTAEITENNK